MPWTKTTPTEEDFSSLQSDIRLMEIAEDPAEFRNFLPGHLQENSSTSETGRVYLPILQNAYLPITAYLPFAHKGK